MIIILKRNANPEKVEILKQELEHKGFKLHLSQGTQTSLIGLIGDTTAIHAPGKYCGGCLRPEDRRRALPGHRRSMLHRDQRADHPGGRGCEALRSPPFTGRGLQAQDFPLCLPGTP